MRTVNIIAPIVVASFIWSCQRNEPEPLTPAAGTVPAIDSAVLSLSTARCDYQQRCNRIGPESRYSDRDHCVNVMRAEARRELNTCRAGIDQDDLRECLTQIANEECGGGMFSRLEEYKDCHLDDLCTD